MKNCRPNNNKNVDVHMSIFIPKKGRNITIITKKCEKVLISVVVFLGKFYFLTSVTFKFYQKSKKNQKIAFG